jgi:hypothetical protein
MGHARTDVIGLFDFAWQRLRERMDGLGEDEWRWRPRPDDDRVTLRWRLAHIADLLSEERCARWLGRTPTMPETGEADLAVTTLVGPTAALAAMDAAYADWRAHLAALTDEEFAAPVGPAGGHHADATRCAFALHIVDELIHHGAEAALLRDLYPG